MAYPLLILLVLLAAERSRALILEPEPAPLRGRLASNIALYLLAGLAAGVILADDFVSISQDLTSGLLASLALPAAVEVVLAFLVFDCWRYWQHRAFHEIPWLWRLHRVHHSDTHLDASTSQRHHPLEAMLTAVTGAILLFALGFSPLSLVVYFGVASIIAIVNHTRLRWPFDLDRRLRLVLATPAVHRVHHSAVQWQTDSNYAGVLTIWDRLFGTWSDPLCVAVPRVGLDEFRGAEEATVLAVLTQPFRRGETNSAPAPQAGAAPDHGSSGQPSPAAGIGGGGRRDSHLGTAGTRAAMVLMVLVAVMWPTLRHLGGVWASSDTYRYAWLVLPLLAYLAGGPWRSTLLAVRPRFSLSGVALLGGCVLGWMLATSAELRVGEHLAFVLSLLSLALMVLGAAACLRLAPLLGLLLFMVPSGDLLLEPLRQLTFEWTRWSSHLFAESVTASGAKLMIDGMGYEVVDECAGLSVALLGAFLGYAFGLMLYRSLFPVILLSLACFVLGVISNLARTFAIVFLDLRAGLQMPIADHVSVMQVSTLLLLGALLSCVALLARSRDAGCASRGQIGATVPAIE